jgi:predicted 3-demethylubiquinone-9 3-methyltransferase (glyoxalase superfamily)
VQKIIPFITFESRGKEAVDFYTSIFKDSKVNTLMAHPETGVLLHASFELDGQEFMAMDGGDHFTFADGVSLFVNCETQEDVDYYWDKLSSEGGEPGQCGWLKDTFGLSWQIVPKQLGELMSDPDPAKAKRVMDAMLKMTKIDIAGLQRAHDET